MPTYANQVAAGRGIFRARLVIEGWPTVYTDAANIAANADTQGRNRLEGLDPTTLRLGATADLVSADLSQTEMSVEFVDSHDKALSASLMQRPTRKTWLTADLIVGAVTVQVASTAGWPSSGVIHIHGEAIAYASLHAGGTLFEGCTRGYWNTTDTAHYTADGAGLSMPAVTDRPATLVGRRVSIFLYGRADSASGTGTQRWRGICRSAPEYQEGRITVAIEPMAWLLDQALGADTDEPSPIRGVYLPSAMPIYFQLSRRTGANMSDASGETVEVILAGFWETQEGFIAALQTEIDAAIASFATWDTTAVVGVQSMGPSGWKINYRAGTTTAYWLQVSSGRLTGFAGGEGNLSPVDAMTRGWQPDWRKVRDGFYTEVVTSGDTYEIDVVAPVPRAWLGRPPDVPGGGGAVVDRLRPDHSNNRLYLGGTSVPTTGHSISIDNGGEEDGTDVYATSTVDATERSVDVALAKRYAMGPNTRVKIIRQIKVSGSFGGFIAALINLSPALVNAGAMPLVTTNDIDTDYSEVEAQESASALALRTWLVSQSVTLRSVIVHELRLRGCYMAIDGTGKIRFKRLRPPLITDASSATVDVDSAKGGFPSLSISPYGFINRVTLRQKWDYIEEEHRGPSVNIRNVEISDASPTAGVLEVAPRSSSVHRLAPMEYTVEAAYLMAASRLGMFGGAYRVVTIEVSMVHFLVELGSVIALDTAFLPDNDGTHGIDTVGLLIGYDWSPYEGSGTFTILLLDLSIGGYSPGLLIASAVDTSAAAGTSWDLTVTLAPHTAETNVSTWFAAGDEIRIMQRDSETPSLYTGVVDSVTDATTVAVTISPSWGGVSASGDHILTYDTTALVDEASAAGRAWAQTDFASIAGSDRRVAYASGDSDAVEFSP